MPKDLRNFKNVKINDVQSKEGRSKIKKQVGNIDLDSKQQAQVERLKDSLSDYKDKSSREIYDDIKKMTRDNKAKGSLDNEKLNQFAKNVSPMLNGEQKQRLDMILKQLKKI